MDGEKTLLRDAFSGYIFASRGSLQFLAVIALFYVCLTPNPSCHIIGCMSKGCCHEKNGPVVCAHDVGSCLLLYPQRGKRAVHLHSLYVSLFVHEKCQTPVTEESFRITLRCIWEKTKIPYHAELHDPARADFEHLFTLSAGYLPSDPWKVSSTIERPKLLRSSACASSLSLRRLRGE